MKRILVALLFFVVIKMAQAQVVDFGVSLRSLQYSQQSLTPDYSGSSMNCDITIGLSAPLLTVANDFNLGIYTSASLGLPFGSSSNNPDLCPEGLVDLSVPLYLTFGYGAGTKKESNRKFGFKVGAGYQMTNALLLGYDEMVYSCVHPQIMAEIAIKLKKYNGLKIRYEKQLSDWSGKGYFELTPNSNAIGFTQQSISVTMILSKSKRRETLMYDLSN